MPEFDRCARYVLALPCYPRDPAWPPPWTGAELDYGNTPLTERPDGMDLVVLDGADSRAHPMGLREAFATVRQPGVHDPAQDPTCHCLTEEDCDTLLGPPGTRRPATRDLLAQLSPYAAALPWPTLALRAAEAREREADRDIIGGMLDLRRPLMQAAVARQETRTRRDAALAQIRTQGAHLQGRILTACRIATPTALRDALLNAGSTVTLVDPDADEVLRHLVPEERDDPALRVGQAWPASVVIAPGEGEIHAAFSPSLATYARDLARLRDEIADDESTAQRLDAWIARNLDHVVAAAARQAAAVPGGDILARLQATRLRFLTPPGGCPILGPTTPEGDEHTYLELMAEARPCEAVLGLEDPREWPNLLDHLSRLPGYQRLPARVLKAGAARMTFSGATDVRPTRRPGLVGRTRFEALRLGEQKTLTVPVPPEERNAYTRLRPGQILRVTAREANTVGLDSPQAGPDEEIDLMVVASPRMISAGRLGETSLTRLAHREGMRPDAYRALIAGKGAGVILSVRVVDVRAVSRDDDDGRHRAKVQHRSLGRDLGERALARPVRGRSR